jgi:putative ABC transport system substrate-binding protein
MARASVPIGIAVWLLLSMSTAMAQAPTKVARVGWLAAFPGPAVGMHMEGLRAGLAALGYFAGRNVIFEEVSAEGVLDRIPALAEELVRRKVDVIVTQGPAVFGAQTVSNRVPIIYGYSGDPVEAKFADSLARPRGNMTGQTYMSIELNGKRIEMLREILPQLRRVAILANPQHPGEQFELADSRKTAAQLGVEIVYRQASDEAELNAALESLMQDSVQALVVFPDELTVTYRARVIEFALKRRIPMISGWSIFAKSGALLTYGPKISEVYRDLARYVVRILDGAKPADLPIERPSVFELVVNLTTAKTLGLTVPPALLSRADEVIE